MKTYADLELCGVVFFFFVHSLVIVFVKVMFFVMQQPVKLMSCTFVPAKRLGCAPWLKDVDDYTYSRKRPNKSK